MHYKMAKFMTHSKAITRHTFIRTFVNILPNEYHLFIWIGPPVIFPHFFFRMNFKVCPVYQMT